MEQNLHYWGIVLAGGEGCRVQKFLAALCGGKGIKQYCAVLGRRSLLERTLLRVQTLIPPERVLVIVDARHRLEVAQQLAHWPQENILYQPANRETGPGIMLPLAHITQRDPRAAVAVFPSDHFILEESQFMTWVARAFHETERHSEQAILLGMTPDRLEEGYGWIEPAGCTSSGSSQPVVRFHEKPSAAEAKKLLARKALWNTFVFTARAPTLWDMARRTMPDICNVFETVRLMLASAHAPVFIEHAYQNMRPANFSSEVLGALASRLRVLAVPDVGWSDWGSVERILATVQAMGRLHEMAARLKVEEISDPSTKRVVARFLNTYSANRAAHRSAKSLSARQAPAEAPS